MNTPSSNDTRLEVDKGSSYWISFEISNPSSSPVYIDSVILYCEQYQEADFITGNVHWQIGTGWPGPSAVWGSHYPPIRIDEAGETTDSWDITSFIPITDVNNIEFCIQNNDNDKLTFQDYIYLEIIYAD